MKNILKLLYEGEIYPSEEIVPSDPDYWILSDKISDMYEYFMTKLNKADCERLEELQDMNVDICYMNCYAGFCYGLKFGTLLMGEILSETEEPEHYKVNHVQEAE